MSNEVMSMKNKTTLISIIISLYFWVGLFVISAILFPISLLIWLLTFLFDKNLVLLHKYSCLWSGIVLASNPYWRTKILGREKVKPGATYVMVSNHQSGADILVLFRLFIPFKWVSKKGLFYIPFLGWNMTLNGYIPLQRSRGRSKRMMMDRGIEAMQKGNSVMIFPEGTRSKDGLIQSFKSGAFRLALATGSPILPIALKGTFHAIRKGGFIIPFDTIRDMEPHEIAGKIHDLIKLELGQ
jgi:1-acyl-sn-glycerol-3-phosphate acyltransferase